MRLACCQLDIAWEDKTANYRRVEALVEAAGLPPGTLLLLPEMFATGFTMNAPSVAEAVDGPTAGFVSGLACRHGIFVQAGVVVRDAGAGQPRNEALVFDPVGRQFARYAKMHLFSFAGEPAHYSAGQSPVLFDWQAVLVAPAICYDLRFPELFRHLIKSRAQVLAVIACWPAPREEHWLALLRARAIENQCFVVAANRCGRDPSGLAYGGRSQIIDPRGEVLTDAGTREGVIQAEIDLEAQDRYRREFPALADMRLSAGLPH
jgi:predicted amidohydrolase